jgi:hypothetical protein
MFFIVVNVKRTPVEEAGGTITNKEYNTIITRILITHILIK